MPVHVEFTLNYLIQRAGAGAEPAGRRLDDFERTIARLARSWRPDRPIAPARELRMADETRDAFVAWVEGTGADTPTSAVERLGVYASGAVTDDSVPEGWVRLRLDATTRPN
ncbi:MAG: hypothetical protein HOQ17_08580 [Gemmatimonadaceae bacterium]|nr:hypothetical protein [Gemmatimonadaceae bacterium]NUO96176.1 hypothetical protein [Gemmatimonadaceae bacterium]NUP55938.1 hypothetical protein [Gemmatimonadaceae bacterium]NUP70341.1 hypothetical protein [Gemmatimonadaceae bacterium]NUR34834.1 hypothetical protein [Gemmatimonadaceae bacterium]